MTALTDLTATAAAALIARRELSAVELTQACLERIALRDGEVHAFAHLDADFALAEAAKADRTAPRSPLHGVPFGVKDVIDTQDLPTACGTPIFAGRRPRRDARCVALMREAGAVLLGKLVTTEFAMFTPNATRHPLNPARTPGGSSSGTAAAVADRMVPIAFGNQTAGSLIRPAAFCGVYGLKPTHGTTDCAGILPLQPCFDTLGYMARAIDDLQAFYAVVSEREQTAAWPAARRPRLGLCRTREWELAQPEARQVLLAAAAQFAAQGADVDDFALPDAYVDLVGLHRHVLYAGIARSLADTYAKADEQMSPGLLDVLAEGRAVDAQAYAAGLARVAQYRDTINGCFGGFDALICPSAPGEAPAGMATGNPIFQVSWTLLGVPCLNLPVGSGPHGLPVGIQLVGRRHDDARLLGLGRQLMKDFQSVRADTSGDA